ncbi:unnamed protein product [Debaryomyces fabryi]|nr:unnamed protein product [Debaryomyces fabryi]
MPTDKSWYDAVYQLTNLVVRDTYNILADLQRYTPEEAFTTRLLAIISSTISIFAGIIGIYFFLAIDYKKRVFRHQLIFFLILYDCIKALFLLLYPARVLARASVYYDLKFCKVVGFFTALSIEGSDIAILSFAIHIALLVFKPNQTVRRGMSYEGGLFRYRYYVYAISILLPILLASLAFINSMGYEPLTNWCYIPTRPLWYRLVLSWIPRYLIIISIFVIYGCVYRHVTKQYNNVGNTMIGTDESKNENMSIWKRFCKALGFVLFLNVLLSDSPKMDENQPNDAHIENNHNLTPENLNDDTLQQFRKRRLQVERQMKTIFIYPVSYIFLWVFPLTVHALDFKYGISRKPIVWLNSISAFMQPLNCTVDTIVFLIRERPWNIITSEVDTSPTENYAYPRWRHLISFLPLFSLPKPHYTQESELKDTSDIAFTNSYSDSNFHDYSKILSGTHHIPNSKSARKELNNSDSFISPNEGFQYENLGKRYSSEHNKSDQESAEEMDFTEFLKMGPVR